MPDEDKNFGVSLVLDFRTSRAKISSPSARKSCGKKKKKNSNVIIN